MKEQSEYLTEWNEKHCALVADPSYNYLDRNEIMAIHCEDLIIRAKEAYYSTPIPIMSDRTYDWLEDMLKILKPDSAILKIVG